MFNTFYLKNKEKEIKRKPVNLRVILFTNARNEKHIVEWAAHHLGLGFDIVYIFDHKSIIPISTLIKKHKGVVVKRIEDDGPIKINLMKKAVKISKALNFDWMIYLDADEFLNIRITKNVKDFLKLFYFADSLGINWLMFGSNNHINDPNGLIVESYTKSENILDQHVKTFVRPHTVKQVLNPHSYIIYNSNRIFGLPVRLLYPPYHFNNTGLSYLKVGAYIAHYIYQSEESYKRRKCSLPADDTGTFRNVNENIHIHHNKIVNNELKDKYSEKIKYVMEQIKNF